MLKRFLIVEDHPIYAEALQLIICNSMADVRITHVGTLREAKDAIRQEKKFDLVLLDLCLPDTHGFEGLIELRVLAPKLPIVIVSAFADQSVVQKSLVCGASGFIPKTADKDALLQALADILAGHVTPPGGVAAAGRDHQDRAAGTAVEPQIVDAPAAARAPDVVPGHAQQADRL